MSNELPIIHIEAIETTEFGQGENFHAKLGRLGPVLGMTKLGCTLVVLKPGKRAWPYHLHYGIEELFVILEGHGSIRYDGKEHGIKSGDIIFTPTGDGTAHQIINNSDKELRYLALSSMQSPEMCYYPDSGKYAAYSFQLDDISKRKAFIAHEKSGLEYWDGELPGK